jgi:hypothetical protein
VCCSDEIKEVDTDHGNVHLASKMTEPQAPGLTRAYFFWRRVHLGASGLLALLALAHSVLTFVFYSDWSADAVWFLGTGLGLLLLAVLNLTHIGVEPCRQVSARVVRLSNPIFAILGVGAVIAVQEPQAYVVLVGLVGQALAAQWTLPGPE